jgi:hypothetical protein
MADYRTITVDEVPALRKAIVSAVEHRSDYGKVQPDWRMVIDDIENAETGLDLGTDMLSPVIRAILKIARRVYRDLEKEDG